jgi:2-octaprenyl-6-methoxyphenol hydroxylase
MTLSLSDVKDGSQIDVLVVGAGMVGASTAIGLAKMGLNILVVDAFQFPQEIPEYTPSYDERSTALSWGTRGILTDLDVWHEVEKRACPITDIHVSEKGRFGTARMSAAEYKQAALGYVVPNQWLGRCLLQKMTSENIPFCTATKVTAVSVGECYQKVTLSSIDNQPGEGTPTQSKNIQAKLILIVDGTESKTAKLLGITHSVAAYSQHALIANVSTSQVNNGVAYERFTSEGPLAMLPLADNTIAVVWTHDEAKVQAYLDMDEQAFCLALEKAFGQRLGCIEKCGERKSYPLRLVKAEEQFRPGVLLLGNAAHSLHPVAGQGFNLAVRGVAALLAHVKQATDSGRPFETLSALAMLCRSREDDQLKTIGLSDQLVKVFGSSSPLINVGRDLGLIGLDNAPIVKSLFASQTMGLAGKKANFG